MKYMIRRMLALVFVLLLSMAAIVPAEEPANEHVMGEGGITGDAFAEDERLTFAGKIFDAVKSDSEFDEIKLAELIDTEEIKDWGDDHSAILFDLRKQG